MLLATTVGTAGCGEHGFDLVCDQIIWLLLARYLTGTIHPAGSFWTLFGPMPRAYRDRQGTVPNIKSTT